MAEYSPYLFNNPHVEINADGDVMPDSGLVAPMNPHKANAELISDHPEFTEENVAIEGISKQLSAKDQAMAAVDHLRGQTPFSINNLPIPKDTGTWAKASRSVRRKLK